MIGISRINGSGAADRSDYHPEKPRLTSIATDLTSGTNHR
jgi:hypothetical protein